jgi:hypothetical protein
VKKAFVAFCLLAFLFGCSTVPEPVSAPAPEYQLIRPGSAGPGPVSNEPLYKKKGDPTGVYIRSLDGGSYIRLSR